MATPKVAPLAVYVGQQQQPQQESTDISAMDILRQFLNLPNVGAPQGVNPLVGPTALPGQAPVSAPTPAEIMQEAIAQQQQQIPEYAKPVNSPIQEVLDTGLAPNQQVQPAQPSEPVAPNIPTPAPTEPVVTPTPEVAPAAKAPTTPVEDPAKADVSKFNDLDKSNTTKSTEEPTEAKLAKALPFSTVVSNIVNKNPQDVLQDDTGDLAELDTNLSEFLSSAYKGVSPESIHNVTSISTRDQAIDRLAKEIPTDHENEPVSRASLASAYDELSKKLDSKNISATPGMIAEALVRNYSETTMFSGKQLRTDSDFWDGNSGFDVENAISDVKRLSKIDYGNLKNMEDNAKTYFDFMKTNIENRKKLRDQIIAIKQHPQYDPTDRLAYSALQSLGKDLDTVRAQMLLGSKQFNDKFGVDNSLSAIRDKKNKLKESNPRAELTELSNDQKAKLSELFSSYPYAM